MNMLLPSADNIIYRVVFVVHVCDKTWKVFILFIPEYWNMLPVTERLR